ncbi:hypothetical protein LCGC14_2247360 [marine sediment metagenome]|uniref:Uncharacterized protein n=1 Tax=marine sediment metagenome TaxID=412755 RepID=A0A0F9FG88_9ZZZZ
MSIAFSWLNTRYWSFIVGVYRYGDEVTFCFGVFSVQVVWEPR